METYIVFLVVATTLISSATAGVSDSVHEFVSKCNDTSGVCVYKLTIPVEHAKEVLNSTDRWRLFKRLDNLTREVRQLQKDKMDFVRTLRVMQTRMRVKDRMFESLARQVATNANANRYMNKKQDLRIARLNETVETLLKCKICNRTSQQTNQTGPCNSTLCQNNGICFNTNGTYACLCQWGFEGKNCERRRQFGCSRIKCMNGGKCVNGTEIPRCVCPNNFEGQWCERLRNRCTDRLCLNGGRCINGTINPVCVCPKDFVGNRCQRRRNRCIGFKCHNGGICVNGTRSPTCVCKAGFEGPRCQTRSDLCEGWQCENGQCIIEDGKPVCECPEGFEGEYCERKIDICYDKKPCQNNGTCVNEGQDYRCICPSRFQGKNCNLPAQSGCGGHRFLQRKGKFRSHDKIHGRLHHEQGRNCTWTLSVDNACGACRRIKVDFKHFHFRHPDEFVIVYAGPTMNGRVLTSYTDLSSKKKPKKMCFNTSVITIHYVAKSYSGHHHGIELSFDKC